MAGIIINLPYAAQAAPLAVARRLNLSEEETRLENWRLTDPYLLEIARQSAARKKDKGAGREILAYPFSPLVADPADLWPHEFSEAPENRPPYFLFQTSAGAAINWSEAERAAIWERSVKPYHESILAATEKLLEAEGIVLVLTLCSFNSVPWVFEKDKRYPRPQVSIGGLGQSTPKGLAELAGGIFKEFGWWPELDWPRKSAFLPESLLGRPRVKALGLALSRGLYMDEKTGRKLESLKSVVRVMRAVINMLGEEMDRVMKLRLTRLAPKKAQVPEAPDDRTIIKGSNPQAPKEYMTAQKSSSVIKKAGPR